MLASSTLMLMATVACLTTSLLSREQKQLPRGLEQTPHWRCCSVWPPDTATQWDRIISDSVRCGTRWAMTRECIPATGSMKQVGMGPEGVEALEPGLAANTRLEVLRCVPECSIPLLLLAGASLILFACSLQRNPIGDRGAAALARALSHLRVLLCVWMRCEGRVF